MTISLFLLASVNQETASTEAAVSLKEVTPFVYVCISHKGPFTEIENVIGQLMMSTQSQNIFPAGPMIGIYHNSPEEVKPEELQWEVGFPVTPQVMPQSPLEKKQWTHTQVAAATHTGPYEQTGVTIAKIFEWMEANGFVQAGPILERYLTIPTPDTKPEELKSEIWVPCQQK
jgi:effector-binding domain-containing protein